jgi:hypothetical protein
MARGQGEWDSNRRRIKVLQKMMNKFSRIT